MKKSLFMSLSVITIIASTLATATAANTAPQISGKPIATAVDNKFYQFKPHGTDADVDDTLTYAVSNLPS
jgi:hypothetical protein